MVYRCYKTEATKVLTIFWQVAVELLSLVQETLNHMRHVALNADWFIEILQLLTD